jgi:hypothetical protein
VVLGEISVPLGVDTFSKFHNKFGSISPVIGPKGLLSLCSRTPRDTLIYPKARSITLVKLYLKGNHVSMIQMLL